MRHIVPVALDFSMKILAVTAALLATIPVSVTWCQTVPRTTLSGVVTDESNGRPIPYVNVYVSGSTLGAATDEHGRFEIRQIPVGVHEVVASHVAYSSFTSRIRFVEDQERTIKISLNPRSVELGEVEVVSKDPTEWRKNLATFKRLFLGSTRNSKMCTIRNPEVLDFGRDEAGEFTVSARSPLVIENEALGYTIEYAVDRFTFDGTYLKVSAQPRFIPLVPATTEEQEFWTKNRLRAYHGSLRHFLVSLIHHRILQEGFRVASVKALGRTPRLDDRSAIDWESLIVGGDVSYETVLRFDDFLEIEFWGEDIENGYDLLRRGSSERQTSWIKMNGALMTVSAEGDIKEPFPLTVFGYWAWERVADTLPSDYVPAEPEN